MARCNSCNEELTGCNCSWTDSDCIAITGDGSDDNPHQAQPIIDPDGDNLLSCEVGSGLLAELPPEIANPPACRVYNDSNQNILTATDLALAFNQERFDTDTMHVLTAGLNTRITFNTAGVYVITLSVTWSANASGDRKIRIRLNGSTLIASDERSSDQNDDFDHAIGTTYKFAVNDYIEAYLGQNSGVTLQILNNGNYSPEMAAVRVGVG